MHSNARIAVNTAAIYIRLLITIFVSLFSTRYVLLALGESNYGIYSLVAGVVVLFSFISATMAGTTQRYISYNMGQGNIERVGIVFYNSCIIHITIAIVVVLFAEIGGLYLINHVLSIPPESLSDARFVLHCVIFGLVCSILTVPYEAVLMAHENIVFVSLVNIFNSFVRLVGAIVLLYLTINRLRVYAVLMAVLPLICLISQYLYCVLKYSETKLKEVGSPDYSLMKEMGEYAGWVLIGVTCGTVRTQGAAILLNMFFGVIANTANGIAMQVNGVLQQFALSITTSIRPQLVKSAGEKNDQRMLVLTYAACKYPSLLFLLFAIPMIIAMPYILEVWLKEVPENTAIFCRLMLLSMIPSQLTMGLTIAIEAIGWVKLLHLTIGTMHIVSIPVGYILFRNGFSPQTIFWCIVAEETISAVLRIIMAKKMINISIKSYLKNILLKTVVVSVFVSVIGYFLWEQLDTNIYNLFIFCIVSAIMYAVSVFLYGFNQGERDTVLRQLSKAYTKIKTYI